MPYDIDGTEILHCWSDGTGQVWASKAEKTRLNHATYQSTYVWQWGGTGVQNKYVMFFFPERREITHCHYYVSGPLTFSSLEGSNDTKNGVDGTWEPAIMSGSVGTSVFEGFRTIREVSFSAPMGVIRFLFIGENSHTAQQLLTIHLFGAKAATETPDDILIMENSTDEFVALKDWGDRPEGTVVTDSFRLKNASLAKIANSINIQINDPYFLISWDPAGPWTTFLDIASLAPGSVSSPIYIKNELAPPLLVLGPKAARVIVGVDSWT